MTLQNNNDIRCSVCRNEFNLYMATKYGVRKCPKCGTEIAPIMIAQDILIKINWQDLRILANYAKRWVYTFDMSKTGNKDMSLVLENIIQQIGKYRPQSALPIITKDEDQNEDNKKNGIKSPYFFGRII